MKKGIPLLAAILCLMIITGCDNIKKMNTVSPEAPEKAVVKVGGSEKLYMHKWALATLNNKSVNSGAFVEFTAGQVNRVNGNTGCNNFSGGYTLTSNNSIKFSPLASTEMACVPDNSVGEMEFLKALQDTDSWSVTDTDLSFYKGNVLLAKFTTVK